MTAQAELARRPHLMPVWDAWTGAASPAERTEGTATGRDGYLGEGHRR